ncbi:hypothetical protein JAAARDRAFT_200938 [Jaapia argillacea MUCL 33604]|uniref:Uncharacterized protein n=1 Tax=Jaapia argillacea MUCL 33604 TaxID=933084 RepID=A0A067P354_9AGAM|nr:hypothetical protein JAAARDRAFT_200938 [Jaapia argillacea MUCL 33604]
MARSQGNPSRNPTHPNPPSQPNDPQKRPGISTFIGASGSEVGYHQSLSTNASTRKTTQIEIDQPPKKRQRVQTSLASFDSTPSGSLGDAPPAPPPKCYQLGGIRSYQPLL